MKKDFLILFTSLFSVVTSASSISRPTLYPFIAGDTFRAISNHIVDETHRPFDPKNVQAGDIIFLKTELAKQFFTSLHPQIDAPYILITHNSDFSPIDFCAADHPNTSFNLASYLDDPKIIVWFSQNIDRKHAKLIPIPIGVGNSYCQHGNIDRLKQALQSILPLQQRTDKMYINISSNHYLKERIAAKQYFEGKNFCHQAARKPFQAYLEEIKQFKFIFSPPGNGFDCHRTWEALLMGCIPVVKSSLLDPLYENLPVIIVEEWNNIDPVFLEQKYRDIQNGSYDMSKIYADYWINLIKSYQNLYKQ